MAEVSLGPKPARGLDTSTLSVTRGSDERRRPEPDG